MKTARFFVGMAGLVAAFLAADPANAQAPEQTPSGGAEVLSSAPQTLSWPRVYQEGALTLTLYQPQIEQWDDATMTFRAAIALQSEEGVEPIYGMVRMTARADVDKAARLVTLQDFQIAKVSFPSTPAINDSASAILLKHLPADAKVVSLDRIEASLAVSEAVKKQRALGVNNDPPRIIFSQTPSLLVLVDGPPVLRPMTVPGAERVLNTQALIVRMDRTFYLTALNYWYQALAVEGPWASLASPADNPPQVLVAVRQAALATNQVDLMQPEAGTAPPEAPPTIYVSTVPAELIQTDGPPQMVPIEGTGLYQAQNSDDPIFMDGDSGSFYVLLSGRWFRSSSLQNGPWEFVPAANLPPDFAKIPPDNPRANVLVSVPHTPEAREALIANSIPQTATVTCGPGNVDLDYDGAPEFDLISGTAMYYAVNASLPVIQCAPGSFYCVQNGIWFFAPSPVGPWFVATVVPTAIYWIPISCPVHYVTYVRIYGWTGNTVCVGYTPGYLGTVVSEDGVVVFGTGYRYRSYIGGVWLGRAYTYGFHASFACGPDTSFAFGFAAGVFDSGQGHPWWGPYRWGWRHDVNYNHVSLNHLNLYEHWQGRAVSVPRRGEPVRAEERVRGRGREVFNPYTARPAAPVREVTAAMRPRTPAGVPVTVAKPPPRDWSANARPRPLPPAHRFAAPTELSSPSRPSPAGRPPVPEREVTGRSQPTPTGHPPVPEREVTGKSQPTPTVRPPVPEHEVTGKPQPTPTARPSQAVGVPREVSQHLQNNVFTSENGQVYRLAPKSPAPEVTPKPASGKPAPAQPVLLPPKSRAPETERPGRTPEAAPPVRRPEIAPPPRTPEPAPLVRPAEKPPIPQPVERSQPSAPVQWEQRTNKGWQPAAQNPAFQKVAPQLNREAAARETGDVRASSARESAPSEVRAPITPNRRAAPSAPPPSAPSEVRPPAAPSRPAAPSAPPPSAPSPGRGGDMGADTRGGPGGGRGR